MSGISASDALELTWFLEELNDLSWGRVTDGRVTLTSGLVVNIESDPPTDDTTRHFNHKVAYICRSEDG